MIDLKRFLSLRVRFVIMLVLAVLLSFVGGALVNVLSNGLIQSVYMSPEACEARCRSILDSFESYVEEKELDVWNGREISQWARKRGELYLMVSDEERVLIDSGWQEEDYYSLADIEGSLPTAEGELMTKMEPGSMPQIEISEDAFDASVYTESYGYGTGSRPIRFRNGVFLVTVYDYSDNALYEAADAAVIVTVLVVLFGIMVLYHNSVTKRIILLSKEVESIAEGNLNDKITVRKGDEIGELADHVDMMRYAIVKEMRAEQEAWKANSDLITRMSHDIRTPLTVLVGFLELLEEGEFSEGEAYRDYLGICKKNAFQMKRLADKLFQYFLVFGHDASKVELEPADAKVLYRQLLSEHTVLLQEQGWTVRTEMQDVSGVIKVDPFHMKRLFDNLFSNVEKYGDPARLVTVRVWREGDMLLATIRNSVRCDPQQAESTNMGLKTCERIAELMGGSFMAGREQDSYEAKLSLPVCRE